MDESTGTESVDVGASTGGEDVSTTQTTTAPATGSETAPAGRARVTATTFGEGQTLIDGLGAETKPEEKAADGFYNGKYKSLADFEKSHKELERKFHEKHQIPETYDFQTAANEAGLTPYDTNTEEGKADAEEFEQFLRENKLSQAQTNALAKYGQQWMQKQLLKHGPQVDKSVEMNAIRTEWGDQTEKYGAEVKTWAEANLPPAVLTKPLIATAEGWKFMRLIMQNQRGPMPIKSSETAKPALDLEADLDKLMMSDSYRNSLDPHHKETQERARSMMKQLQSRK